MYKRQVQKGESSALVSQIDLYASLASLLDVKLEDDEAVDSHDIMSSLMNANVKGREELLEESFTLSIREGKYKYIKPITVKNLPKWLSNKNVETGLLEEVQLYDLSKDVSEKDNIANENKELVERLDRKIDSIVSIN